MLQALLRLITALVGTQPLADVVISRMIRCVLEDSETSKAQFRALVADWLPDDSAVERLWFVLWDVFYEDITQLVQDKQEEASGHKFSKNDRVANDHG